MAKIAGKSLVFKIGSPLTEVAIFDPKISEKAGEIDVTDSMSADDAREFLAGYKDNSFSFAQWFKDDADPLAVGDVKPFEWTIGAKKATGTIVITGRDLGATRDDAHRFDFQARINGDVTIA